VPVAAYVRFSVPAQVEGGGVLQVVVAHGSDRQPPATQPNAQVLSDGEYVHDPPVQDPVAANVRRVVALRQVAIGGLLQVTMVHGSAVHAFPLQVQVIVCDEYRQIPPTQLPTVSYACRCDASRQVLEGGPLQTFPRQGSLPPAPAVPVPSAPAPPGEPPLPPALDEPPPPA